MTTYTTPIYTILGIVFLLIAIPFGLMLTPLIIGGILLFVGLRRADRALQPTGPRAAG